MKTVLKVVSIVGIVGSIVLTILATQAGLKSLVVINAYAVLMYIMSLIVLFD